MATKTPEPVAPEALSMTAQEALNVLDTVCAQVPLSRNDHQTVLTALNVLLGVIGPE